MPGAVLWFRQEKEHVKRLEGLPSTFNSMVEVLAEKERFEESLRISRVEDRQREGIIPLCMYCKKIRNAKDFWEKLVNHQTERSEALFSHGICQECTERDIGKKY